MSDTDPARWSRIRDLFKEAMRVPEADRDSFAVRMCGDDPGLLAELRALLAASDDDISLSRIVGGAAVHAASSGGDGLIEQKVGNYQLASLLGTGGMGSVYLGRRIDEQFEHEVAIKVLQTGSSNEHFVERFRAERQVLANLNHPNIAKLLDGGVTGSGMQFLVMEFVRGEQLDTYCDVRQLNIRQRLRLFQKICLAVDYAHHNLVIHRDVKPSNILVTDDGIPKLLDFGIAKVMSASDMQQPLTLDNHHLLTPEYASPEQVRGEPVSTATDVYSLGVLLYRLLCGRRPYRPNNDLPSGLVQAILEESPSRPSTVLDAGLDESDDEQSGAEISAQRQSTVGRLSRRLQGDLDTIALMALRKEPERRYASARALHDDIENYLSNRPVSARADSLAYLSSKFIRRHRVGVASATAFVLLLAGSGLQIVEQRDRAEAQAATAERVSDFLISMLESSNPYERSPDVTARALLDRGALQVDIELDDEPLIGARLRTTMARAYSSLGMQNTAAALAQAALDELANLQDVEIETGNAQTTMASIEYERQDYAAAKSRSEAALTLYGQASSDATTQVALAKVELSRAFMRLDESEAMLVVAEEAVEALEQQHGIDDPQTNAAIANLGALYNVLGDYETARVHTKRVVQWVSQTYGDDDILMAEPLHSLGRITWNLGDYYGADTIYQRELVILEAYLGPVHPSLHEVLVSIASNQRKIGYEATAKSYYERAIAVLEGAESPPLGKLADTYGSLGTVLMDTGHLDEAEPLIRRALDLNQQVHGIGNADNAFRLLHLGILHRKRGESTEARRYIQQAVDATLNRYDDSHRNVQIMRLHLGVTEGEAGNHDVARRILKNVLNTVETNLGKEHPLAGQSLLELAALELDAGEFEVADVYLVRSLDNYRAIRDKWHPDIQYALRLRADIYNRLGDDDRAAQFKAEADELYKGSQSISEEEARETGEASF